MFKLWAPNREGYSKQLILLISNVLSGRMITVNTQGLFLLLGHIFAALTLFLLLELVPLD